MAPIWKLHACYHTHLTMTLNSTLIHYMAQNLAERSVSGMTKVYYTIEKFTDVNLYKQNLF